MNAAEITDKLGLHSLRQRAWVSRSVQGIAQEADRNNSTFNPLALHLVTVFMRGWSG